MPIVDVTILPFSNDILIYVYPLTSPFCLDPVFGLSIPIFPFESPINPHINITWKKIMLNPIVLGKLSHSQSGWWYTYPSEKYESQMG